MANKIKTRPDQSFPDKNKVATLVGIAKKEPFYQDLLSFKLEHNGVEQPLNKLLERQFDKLDSSEALIKKLIGEIALLTAQNELLLQAIEQLDSRLDKLETQGQL